MIIFITGLPKSGTTYLSNILNELPGFKTYYEGHWFTNDSIYPSFWESLNFLQYWFKRQAMIMGGWVTENKPGKIPQKEIESNFGLFCKDILRERFFFLSRSSQNVIDKTPCSSLNDIKNMQYVFPEAKIIFMQRNFPDWLISSLFFWTRLFEKEGGGYSFLNILTELDYFHFVDYKNGEKKYPIKHEKASMLLEEYQNINNNVENVMKINYEDLYKNPITTTENLLEKLNLYGNPGKMVKKGKNPKTLMKDFRRSGKIDDWKNYIDEQFLKEINFNHSSTGLK